ncbi:MAG: transposase [Verrucomicrobiaceae bacterium]
MPADRVTLWKSERAEWLAKHPAPRSPAMKAEYQRIFTQRWHKWLDESHGACVLKEPALRTTVENILRHLDGESTGYALDEFVIMPNHVHALVSPATGQSQSKILRDWKSVSAHHINKALNRKGPLWQEESWDHIVRNPLYLEKYRKYIRENPDALFQVGRQPSAGF